MPGVWVFPGGAVDADELEAHDEEQAHRACAARELEEEAGIELPDAGRARPWSRWITPETVPVRFDTRFYLAPRPAPLLAGARRRGDHGGRLVRARRGARAPRARRARAGLPDGQAPRVAAARYATAEEAARRRARAQRRADPAEGARHQRGLPRRAPGRPRTTRGLGSGVTATLPSEAREAFDALHHLRVHDDRRSPAADRLAGDAVLRRRRRDDRRHHRPRLPEEGQGRRANPRVALFFSEPTGSGDRHAGSRVLVQGTADVDDRDLEANRERYWRGVGREAAGDQGHASAESCAGYSTGTTPRLYVKVRPERVFVWADGDSTRSRSSSTRTSRRSARATARSRSSRTSRRRGAPRMGRADRRARRPLPGGRALLGRPRRLPAQRPRSGLGSTATRGGSASGPSPRAAAHRGPRLPHRAPPRPQLRVAGELPGPRRPRPRRRRAGRSSRTS